MRKTFLLAALVVLLAVFVLSGVAAAQEGQGKTEKRLLEAAEGVQLPSSESDTVFEFVAFLSEEGLPSVERFAELTGCDGSAYPEGGAVRLDFGVTFDRWTRLAKLGGYDPNDYRRLRRAFEKSYDEFAIYRCETGGPENHVYILGSGADEAGVSGLTTTSIET